MSLRNYDDMSDQDVVEAIHRAKAELGASLTILGHHYQRDEVIQFADYRGDSLELSRRAATTKAKYIVFCGVYFMAETAAILCGPDQIVIQPVIEALCPMARLATAAEVSEAWEALSNMWGGDLLPITYQNSIAELKAFVGQRDGAVCTSSNAAALFAWGFKQKGHLLFTPDEHLGTNTALAMGIADREIGVWDRLGSPDPAALRDCRVVVWKGYCYVHTGFEPQHVDAIRAQYPDAMIIVHPECPREVVAKSDATGSTSGIIKMVEQAPAGQTIVIGTECNLVYRLAHEHPDKRILPLYERTCRSMSMTRMRNLLYVLDSILMGQPVNVVTVEPETARWARVALDRMLQAS
ncbi:MAG: quinolinate synthase NadA [Chloroflexi bacterium]|nr:quinolinate synthase NadA [Chloroflexota bacterium]